MTDFEDIYDAMKGAVNALGKAKKVGPRLRPESKDARGWLLNCLNRNHNQNLDPEQLQLLVRWANEAGYHELKHWMDRDTRYQESRPADVEAQIAVALKSAAESKRRLEESERTLRELADNPELLARMKAAGLKLEGL